MTVTSKLILHQIRQESHSTLTYKQNGGTLQDIRDAPTNLIWQHGQKYEAIVAFGGRINPIWTDGRLDCSLDPATGQQIGEEIFTALVTAS